MEQDTCSTCRHRQPHKRPEYPGAGYCRRYPPQIIVMDMGERYEPNRHSIEQHFPWMAADEWCGEYDQAPISSLPTAPIIDDPHALCTAVRCLAGNIDGCSAVPF